MPLEQQLLGRISQDEVQPVRSGRALAQGLAGMEPDQSRQAMRTQRHAPRRRLAGAVSAQSRAGGG